MKNEDKSCANALAYRISKSNIQIFGFNQNLSLLENYPMHQRGGGVIREGDILEKLISIRGAY